MAKELTESRRTRYTRRAMQDALIELLRNQPLGSITVKALCERADVNRSTFYAHYASIEELLHDIEDETMAWVTTALEQLLAQPDPAGIEHVIGADAYAIRRVRQHWAFAILARHRSRGLSRIGVPHHLHHVYACHAVNTVNSVNSVKRAVS